MTVHNKIRVSFKTIVLIIAGCILVLALVQKAESTSWNSWIKNLFAWKPPTSTEQTLPDVKQKVVTEESVVIDVVKSSLPSVVTIGIKVTRQGRGMMNYDPFDPFSMRQIEPEDQTIEQNIGSGFIVTKDGIIITNKHVVLEQDATYSVITNDKKTYEVTNIYRDPLNDLAILKIDAKNLNPLELGDSDKLQLGQLAVAIGTPLGEFQNTITSGIISGLGRGITAGSPYEGFVEQLDSVIQTDAAISPGNSGGPLLNSGGQVIGVNTAVSSEGQNIGFAIPVNIVKELLKSFEEKGSSFERPYIGVRYSMVDKRTAILNDVVEGAYVESVVPDSPADNVGIQSDDIITKIDGIKLDGSDEKSLASEIVKKKVGDKITVDIWRDGEVQSLKMTLEAYTE